MEIYVVQEGDTLYSIAQRFGVSVARLAYDNQIRNNQLVVGQAILVLFPEITHVIREGDTLYRIANQYGITVKTLVRNNSYLLNETFLIPGREVVISYRNQEERNLNIIGYAYSFIQRDILFESCLYIDELLPFSYGFELDASLIEMQDSFLLETASEFQVKKRMVITPLDRNERFNNQLVIQLLGDVTFQETLIENIITIMNQKGYEALDVDFEYIPGTYRDAYVEFLTRLRERLLVFGYPFSVAVPPKVSADQRGLLYEGIDYRGIGQVADTVFLMTYEWGYKYGPPLAVAPISSVRRVLDYAVSEIPASKIIMGIPNYAYDWPLPFESGVTIADTIGNVEAVELALQYGARIEYDEKAQTPFFYYQRDGVEHVVWFEDVRSIQEKYNLVQEYQFLGAGYWNLMREFRSNWMYVNQIIKSE